LRQVGHLQKLSVHNPLRLFGKIQGRLLIFWNVFSFSIKTGFITTGGFEGKEIEAYSKCLCTGRIRRLQDVRGRTDTHRHAPFFILSGFKFAVCVTFLNLYRHHQLANVCPVVCFFSLLSNQGDSCLFVAAVSVTR